MSPKTARQANAYRLRAEEVRTIAESTRDERCRESLMRIADEYERLARVAESMAAGNGNTAHKTRRA
jgi:hypothetical protein